MIPWWWRAHECSNAKLCALKCFHMRNFKSSLGDFPWNFRDSKIQDRMDDMMRLHHGQRISVFNRRKQENKWFKRSNKSNQLISSSLKNLVFYCSFQFNIKKTRHVFNVGRYLTYKISTFKYLTCVSESIKPVTIQEIKRWTTKNRSNAMMQCWMVHYSSIYIFRFPHRCFELRAFRVCHVKRF